MSLISILAAIYLAAYVMSFLVAFAFDPRADTEWQTATILTHFTGGLAVGALIF